VRDLISSQRVLGELMDSSRAGAPAIPSQHSGPIHIIIIAAKASSSLPLQHECLQVSFFAA
jgi:hypothetical protein